MTLQCKALQPDTSCEDAPDPGCQRPFDVFGQTPGGTPPLPCAGALPVSPPPMTTLREVDAELSTGTADPSAPFLGHTIWFIRRYGVGPAVLATSLAASFLASVICYTTFIVFDSYHLSHKIFPFLPPLVPLLITPPISYVLVRRLLRLDELQESLRVKTRALDLLVERLEITQRELERQAVTDELTGLFNRRALFRQVEHEFARSRRTAEPFSLVTLDVDHFKRVNDAHGHAAGDAVLREVARVLWRTLRAVDIAARTGGEEFTILLPNTDREQAAFVAERLRQNIAALRVSFERLELTVTASFGVAAYSPLDLDAGATLRAADLALYTAKRRGRDQVIEASGRHSEPLS